MTIAVCFHCGEQKHGALTSCEACGQQPEIEIEFVYSVAMTDHYFDMENLSQFGVFIRQNGKPPEFAPETQRYFEELVRKEMPMLSRILGKGGAGSAKNTEELNKAQVFLQKTVNSGELEAVIKTMVAELFAVSSESTLDNGFFIEDMAADEVDLADFFVELEKTFGIEISENDAEGLACVADVAAYLLHQSSYN